MSNLASFGSAQASNWAAQRREAMEKAKALRDTKKTSLAKTGEMTMMNQNLNEKNTRANPTRNLSNTGTSEAYGNKANYQEQRTEKTNQYPSQKTNLGNKGKEALGSTNPYSRGMGSMEENYSRSKPLSQTTQPLNQNPTTNQNYRQVYKPNFNNEPEYQGKGGAGQQYQLRTLPKETQENYEDYSNTTASRQSYKTRQDSTQISTQHNMPSRIPKSSINDNKGKNQYMNTYDEPQIDKRQLGAKRERHDQAGYGYEEKAFGHNYQPSTKQQYYPEQQKEYNPMNYGARPSNKGYSEEVYNQPKSRISNEQQDTRKPNYGNNTVNQTRPSSKPISQKDAYNNSSRNSMNSYSTAIEDDRTFNSQNRSQPGLGKDKPSGPESLVECPEGCGRSFFPEVLEKHARVCKKVFQSKRKQFDMTSQRLPEDAKKEVNKKPAQKMTNKTIVNKKPEAPINVSKQAKWKQQSEAFRASMKVARGETLSKTEQVAIASHQQDSLVPCNYCGRRFNGKAAERHIPFCQSKQKDVALKKAPLNKTRKY